MSVRARVLGGLFAVVAVFGGACSSADTPDPSTAPPSPLVAPSPPTSPIADRSPRDLSDEHLEASPITPASAPLLGRERLLVETSNAPRCLEAEAAVQAHVADRLEPLERAADAEATLVHTVHRLVLTLDAARPFLPAEIDRRVGKAHEAMSEILDGMRQGSLERESERDLRRRADALVAANATAVYALGSWIEAECPADWPA